MIEQRTADAPAVTLKAIGHGRELTMNKIGTTALLVFVARETSEAARPASNGVRERWPSADDVTIINVADGRPFPKLIRKVAEQIMKSSYNDAVKNLAPGRTPEQYVLIAPDWDGKVLGALGLEDVSKQVAVAVIGRDGRIAGVYQGDDAAAQAVALVEQAMS